MSHPRSIPNSGLSRLGFLEGLTTDQMNLIQKILTQRVETANNWLFDIPINDDPSINQYIDEYYNRLVAEKRIDVLQKDQKYACPDSTIFLSVSHNRFLSKKTSWSAF